MKKQAVRIFRRSTALALTLVAGWVTLRTAALTDSGQALQILSHDARLAVSLLSAQLPAANQTSGSTPTLTGWQRLVLAQSPLLHTAHESAQLFQEPPVSSPPEQKDEDDSETPIAHQPADDGSVVARTFVPSAAQTYLQAGQIYVADRAQKQVDVASLASAAVNINLSDGPQVLIVHTHGSEAYTPDSTDTYVPSDPYRTTDCNYNMVRVGEEMAQVFRAGGLEVIHDTTLYDYPSYNEAYDRSLAAVERWLKQYPSIQIVLDVHRDALAAEDGTIYKAVSREDGMQAAQVMLVVGTDGGGKFHPLWEENLAFAIRLQQQMLDDYDTLARPMVLRSSRFNQHLSVGSVLVEVGTHGNSLEEALLGARLFAQSAAKVLVELR